MLNEIFLSNCSKLWSFITISEILLFLLIKAILFLLLEILTAFLLSQLVHAVFHDLIIIVVTISRNVPCILISKFKMSCFEILLWDIAFTSFGRKSRSKRHFRRCILGIEIYLSPSYVKIRLPSEFYHLSSFISFYCCSAVAFKLVN